LQQSLPPTGDASSHSNGTRDLEIVRSALVGSRDARASLAARLHVVGRIMIVLNRRHSRALSEHDVEDAIQDTIALLLSKLDTFRGECTIETWVYAFCVNVFANTCRKAARRRSREACPGGNPEGTYQSEPTPYGAGGERDSIETSLARLGPPASEVIRERVFHGRTFTEIGASRNVSESTVKTWYYRGLRELGALLAKDQPA
jgi:RNA polymerase sigma factor (sigma-70 family)